jgi:DMSO/TMAO reductase YedYZ molybdopterin-dependent catalytic subunit
MSETAAVGVSMEELQLAARNHGMPLEALRYPVTPIGLHYLLTHYDIPDVDAASWRLHVDGHVERPVELSLSDLRALPTTTRTVTMECAGNGRALLADHPASQPWLVEAVGTGEWTGVELAHVLATVRPRPAAVEALFTGADRGPTAASSSSTSAA